MWEGYQAPAVVGDCSAKRIEWTDAGGNSFLAVVVDGDEVLGECWGTRKEIAGWMKTKWPQLPTKYVLMVLGATRQHVERRPTALTKQRTAC